MSKNILTKVRIYRHHSKKLGSLKSNDVGRLGGGGGGQNVAFVVPSSPQTVKDRGKGDGVCNIIISEFNKNISL